MKTKNILILLYEQAFVEYNMKETKDSQNMMRQYINNLGSVSYFIKKKQLKNSKNKMEEHIQYMKLFELFLNGINCFLRIIDDEQCHKYDIVFASNIWIVGRTFREFNLS